MHKRATPACLAAGVSLVNQIKGDKMKTLYVVCTSNAGKTPKAKYDFVYARSLKNAQRKVIRKNKNFDNLHVHAVEKIPAEKLWGVLSDVYKAECC